MEEFFLAHSDSSTSFCHWSYHRCYLSLPWRRTSDCTLTSQIREFPPVSIVMRLVDAMFSSVKRSPVAVSYATTKNKEGLRFSLEIEVRFLRAMTGYHTRTRKTGRLCIIVSEKAFLFFLLLSKGTGNVRGALPRLKTTKHKFGTTNK